MKSKNAENFVILMILFLVFAPFVVADSHYSFEHAESFDAQFAKAVDRILPLVQNVANEGGSWAQHSIKRSQVLARNKYLKGVAPRLWEYAKEQIDLAVTKGWLIAD